MSNKEGDRRERMVPGEEAEAEHIEKRSRFIGRIFRTESEEEAQEKIRSIRERHWDAAHNVYAYIIEGNVSARYTDDGEPHGTAGLPVMNVIRGTGMEQICCVVTRYFGGILLGTGGLVRAYSKAAGLAVEAAGRKILRAVWRCRVDCPYNMYERIKREAEENGVEITGTEYGERVRLYLLIGENQPGFEPFNDKISALTSGRIGVEKIEKGIIAIKEKG